jgi:hypothetical protein
MAYSSNTTIEYWPVQFDVVDIDSIHAYLQWESLAMKDNVPSQLSSEIIKWFWERFNGSWYVSCGSTCL